MRLLGIDYGSKRIGVAYSDESGKFAMPIKVVKNDAKALENILSIVKDKEVGVVVLGESKDLKGKNNPIMKDIEVFKKKLEENHLMVHLEREFFTSMHVENKGNLLDASSAALILQRYLDRYNYGNNR